MFCPCSGSSELFATSSKNDVRVWHAETGKELLRVTVSNMTCNALNITPDGKAIITGIDMLSGFLFWIGRLLLSFLLA